MLFVWFVGLCVVLLVVADVFLGVGNCGAVDCFC